MGHPVQEREIADQRHIPASQGEGRDAWLFALVATATAAATTATTVTATAAAATAAVTATAAAAAVTAAATTTATAFFRPRLVNGEVASIDFFAVQGVDRRLGLLVAAHFHESETF